MRFGLRNATVMSWKPYFLCTKHSARPGLGTRRGFCGGLALLAAEDVPKEFLLRAHRLFGGRSLNESDGLGLGKANEALLGLDPRGVELPIHHEDDRYHRTEKEWRCPPAEEQFAEMGITYRLRSADELPRTYISNLTFLADYLRPDCAPLWSIAVHEWF
jgi:hypothetical protein